MQEPRRQRDSSPISTASNADQSKEQPTGVMKSLGSPLIAAAITAATTFMVFSFDQVKQIDARLDELEKEVRILLTPDGVAASEEAIASYYGLQALKERFAYLEGKLHFHEK